MHGLFSSMCMHRTDPQSLFAQLSEAFDPLTRFQIAETHVVLVDYGMSTKCKQDGHLLSMKDLVLAMDFEPYG